MVVFSATLWLLDVVSPVALDVVVRRRVTGLASCSWLPDVALSDFERPTERLFVVPNLACSFPSGDSDVFLMKKTPFYQMMRHKWRRNLSSQPQERTVSSAHE